MKAIILILLSLIIVPFTADGQESRETDSLFNQTDVQGRKQGIWKKYHPNGKTRYRGEFKNNKPVGEFRYYHDNGKLRIIMDHGLGEGKADVKYYYANGELAASGQYLGKQKEGSWKYYSYYSKKLSYVEKYMDGLKHGLASKYYEDGKLSQELEWHKDVRNGKWKIWFPGGQLKLDTNFKGGKLHGSFTNYYPDGSVEITGNYVNDLRSGTWKYTDPVNKTTEEIEYVNGVPNNREELDREFENKLEEYEKNKGKIKEPDINDVNFNKGR